MAVQGYRPCGVDINDDPDDGLRAVRHYPRSWPAILSSFDNLPFPDASVDVAVYNGSFHYSESQAKTLEEAARILRPGGQIIIMDSPIYSDPSSGQKMMGERARYHQDTFNYTSEIEVSGFLTWQGVRGLAAQHGLALSVMRPWYGLKWFLRPLKHRLRGARQPANFSLLVFTKPEAR
jgi:SAM-dependent methyltransferase